MLRGHNKEREDPCEVTTDMPLSKDEIQNFNAEVIGRTRDPKILLNEYRRSALALMKSFEYFPKGEFYNPARDAQFHAIDPEGALILAACENSRTPEGILRQLSQLKTAALTASIPLPAKAALAVASLVTAAEIADGSATGTSMLLQLAMVPRIGAIVKIEKELRDANTAFAALGNFSLGSNGLKSVQVIGDVLEIELKQIKDAVPIIHKLHIPNGEAQLAFLNQAMTGSLKSIQKKGRQLILTLTDGASLTCTF